MRSIENISKLIASYPYYGDEKFALSHGSTMAVFKALALSFVNSGSIPTNGTRKVGTVRQAMQNLQNRVDYKLKSKLSFFVHKSSKFNSFLTDDDTRRFCGHCRSRTDCTERAV